MEAKSMFRSQTSIIMSPKENVGEDFEKLFRNGLPFGQWKLHWIRRRRWLLRLHWLRHRRWLPLILIHWSRRRACKSKLRGVSLVNDDPSSEWSNPHGFRMEAFVVEETQQFVPMHRLESSWCAGRQAVYRIDALKLPH